MRRLGSWFEIAKRLFDEVLERGGIWHLYGHSWEIERLGLWGDLSEILNYVSRREGVSYVQNCALVSHISQCGPLTERGTHKESPAHP
jgi:hypothetical protein